MNKYFLLLILFFFNAINVINASAVTIHARDTIPSNLTQKTNSHIIETKPDVEASFVGGSNAWNRYVKEVIEQNLNDLITDGKSGTCLVRFVIDKNGKVTNAIALTMVGSKLSEIFVNAVKNGPKWIPAMKNGEPVNAYRQQPVTFTVK